MVFQHLADAHAGGITNRGNECFASAVVQSLSALQCCLARIDAEIATGYASVIDEKLGELLLELSWRRYDADRTPASSLSVSALVALMGGFRAGEQHDAAEFLCVMLERSSLPTYFSIQRTLSLGFCCACGSGVDDHPDMVQHSTQHIVKGYARLGSIASIVSAFSREQPECPCCRCNSNHTWVTAMSEAPSCLAVQVVRDEWVDERNVRDCSYVRLDEMVEFAGESYSLVSAVEFLGIFGTATAHYVAWLAFDGRWLRADDSVLTLHSSTTVVHGVAYAMYVRTAVATRAPVARRGVPPMTPAMQPARTSGDAAMQDDARTSVNPTNDGFSTPPRAWRPGNGGTNSPANSPRNSDGAAASGSVGDAAASGNGGDGNGGDGSDDDPGWASPPRIQKRRLVPAFQPGQTVYSRVSKLQIVHQRVKGVGESNIRVWTWEIVSLEQTFSTPFVVAGTYGRNYLVTCPDSNPPATIEMMPQLLSRTCNARMHKKVHVRRHEESPSPLRNPEKRFEYDSEATPIRNFAREEGQPTKKPNKHLLAAQDSDRRSMNAKRRTRCFERRQRAEAERRRPSRVPLVSADVPQPPPRPQHYACPPIPDKGLMAMRLGRRLRPTNELDWCEKFDVEMLAKRPVHCEKCDEEFFGLELAGPAMACKFCRKVKSLIGSFPWTERNLTDAQTDGKFKAWARDEFQHSRMTRLELAGATLLADSVLTLGEQMLIARVMPCMVFWEMSCSAMGYAGHICNKVQNVEEVIDRLPRDPKKVPLLLVRWCS